jgi:hypothetical protein
MGAHPKNKITRAERGKRRRGNTPSLKTDFKVVSVPLHKRGLLNSMLVSMGIVKSAEKTPKAEPAKKATSAQPAVNPAEAMKKPSRVAAQNAPKATVQRTQHKG